MTNKFILDLRPFEDCVSVLAADVVERVSPAASAPGTRRSKHWPHVGRNVDGYGDKNLVCTCPPVESNAEPGAGDAPKLQHA